jgi:hypothetical protein
VGEGKRGREEDSRLNTSHAREAFHSTVGWSLSSAQITAIIPGAKSIDIVAKSQLWFVDR